MSEGGQVPPKSSRREGIWAIWLLVPCLTVIRSETKLTAMLAGVAALAAVLPYLGALESPFGRIVHGKPREARLDSGATVVRTSPEPT